MGDEISDYRICDLARLIKNDGRVQSEPSMGQAKNGRYEIGRSYEKIRRTIPSFILAPTRLNRQ